MYLYHTWMKQEIIIETLLEKKSLRNCRCKQENNIKIILEHTPYKQTNRIQLVQYRIELWAFVKTMVQLA